jgi:TDG/mug DNA glycosylase family protein
MTNINCFSPVSSSRAKVLILGSMPGKVSIEKNQYYAHPRNAFWFIMNTMLNTEPGIPYEKRITILQENGIALWDVLKSCHREGSLDSSIDDESSIPNDFYSFFAAHQKISHVFFNGAKAEKEYKKYVLPTLANTFSNLEYLRLPSTSPALASMTKDEKLKKWSIIGRRIVH